MKKIIVSFLIIFVCILVGIFVARAVTNSQSISFAHKTPLPTPTPVIATPVTLVIPKLHVHSHIESVGLTKDLRMDVPKGIGDTGWYSLGPKPGQVGNAVIDGHFDTPTGAPSVFYYVSTLQKGDSVEVIDQSNKTYTFTVTSIMHFSDKGFPILQVFGPSRQPHLNLITCSGTWDALAHNYSQRTVVFTTLLSQQNM